MGTKPNLAKLGSFSMTIDDVVSPAPQVKSLGVIIDIYIFPIT